MSRTEDRHGSCARIPRLAAFRCCPVSVSFARTRGELLVCLLCRSRTRGRGRPSSCRLESKSSRRLEAKAQVAPDLLFVPHNTEQSKNSSAPILLCAPEAAPNGLTWPPLFQYLIHALSAAVVLSPLWSPTCFSTFFVTTQTTSFRSNIKHAAPRQSHGTHCRASRRGHHCCSPEREHERKHGLRLPIRRRQDTHGRWSRRHHRGSHSESTQSAQP